MRSTLNLVPRRFTGSSTSLRQISQRFLLLGGEPGLQCGEMIALEWRDADLGKRQICVQRSDWNGQVTTPKGGRLRYVPLTIRLAAASRDHRTDRRDDYRGPGAIRVGLPTASGLHVRRSGFFKASARRGRWLP